MLSNTIIWVDLDSLRYNRLTLLSLVSFITLAMVNTNDGDSNAFQLEKIRNASPTIKFLPLIKPGVKFFLVSW